jgi:hypothetical protein
MQGLIDFRYSCVAILVYYCLRTRTVGAAKAMLFCTCRRPCRLLVCCFVRPAQMLQLIESNQSWAKSEESRWDLGVRNYARDP